MTFWKRVESRERRHLRHYMIYRKKTETMTSGTLYIYYMYTQCRMYDNETTITLDGNDANVRDSARGLRRERVICGTDCRTCVSLLPFPGNNDV